jgi:predicted MFS family arabinose efflux permease
MATTAGISTYISGFAISPTVIASFAWIEEAMPTDRITEGMTLFTTGLGAGLAPGAALVGLVVDSSGASAGYWVVIAAGLAGASVALVTTGGTRSSLRDVAPANRRVAAPC